MFDRLGLLRTINSVIGLACCSLIFKNRRKVYYFKGAILCTSPFEHFSTNYMHPQPVYNPSLYEKVCPFPFSLFLSFENVCFQEAVWNSLTTVFTDMDDVCECIVIPRNFFLMLFADESRCVVRHHR